MPIKRTLMKFTSIKSHQSYHCLVCKQKQAYYTANNVPQSSIIGRPPKFSGKSPGNREVCLGVVYQGGVWRVRTTRETMVSDVRHNRSHCDVTPPGAAERGRLLRHIPEVGPLPQRPLPVYAAYHIIRRISGGGAQQTCYVAANWSSSHRETGGGGGN